MFIRILAAAAIGCCISVVVHTILLFRHRRPGLGALRLLFSGYLFFDDETFSESGAALHKRFGYSVLGVFFIGLVMILVAVAG